MSQFAIPFQLPTCQFVPLPDNQVSLQIDGEERTRWHFDAKCPRPFFYPLIGPSGDTLTLMGHPGARQGGWRGLLELKRRHKNPSTPVVGLCRWRWRSRVESQLSSALARARRRLDGRFVVPA